MKPFKIFYEQAGTTGIGLFPGAFKPPHKGHFDTVKKAAVENKFIAVLVSGLERDGISTTDSLTIWNIYKPYLPENVHIYFASGSPVTTVYQIVDILNNGSFTSTARVTAPFPITEEVSKEIQKLNHPYNINLYASKEDMPRFNAFYADKTKAIYTGKNVKAVSRKDVQRVASATDARNALQKRNFEDFKTFLPDITKEDKLRVYKLLVK